MHDIQEMINELGPLMDHSKVKIALIGKDKTNFVNNFARGFGYEKMSLEDPEGFKELSDYVGQKLDKPEIKNKNGKEEQMSMFESWMGPGLKYNQLQKSSTYLWMGGAEPIKVKYIGLKSRNPEIQTNSSIGKGFLFQWPNNKYFELGAQTISEDIYPADALNESLLKETSFDIPSPKIFNRYDDDTVVKAIKDIISNEFENVRLEKITGEEGGAFYNMILSIRLEDDIKDDLERKRFYIMQVMQSFKAQFFGAISAILPIVNMNTGSYQFTKNSDKLGFSATMCLSHTNDRNWVSGTYKGIEDKKQLEFERAADKKYNEKLEEVSKRHALKPMKLDVGIQKFKNREINTKVLETVIKACGRAELEFYVMRSVGAKASVDMSDVDSDSQIADDEDKPKTAEKPYKHEDLTEAKDLLTESPRFDVGEFVYDETPTRDIFDLKQELEGLGCKVNVNTIDKLTVYWPNKRLDKDKVERIIAGY